MILFILIGDKDGVAKTLYCSEMQIIKIGGMRLKQLIN